MSDTSYLNSEQINYLNEAFKEISRESDRAAAILIGAELDYALKEVIEAFILPPAKKSIELTQADAPLGTMASRIEMAYRMGLISGPFHRELHLIRRIRNEFAHRPAGFSFTSLPVCALCQQLRIAQWVIEGRSDLQITLHLDSPRNRFILAGISNVTLLSGMHSKIQRVAIKSPEFDNGDNLT